MCRMTIIVPVSELFIIETYVSGIYEKITEFCILDKN